jgi:hypothetical protein
MKVRCQGLVVIRETTRHAQKRIANYAGTFQIWRNSVLSRTFNLAIAPGNSLGPPTMSQNLFYEER